MNYYTETNYIDHDSLRTAGGKGRDDYFEVLRRTGLECILIPTVKTTASVTGLRRIFVERKLRRAWRRALACLGEGDTIFLHSPVSEKFIGYPGIIEDLHKRGCKIVNIVFDLETFFKSDYRRFASVKHAADRRTEARLFSAADTVICHNSKMREKLLSIGVDYDKVICVNVMDYLRDDLDFGDPGRFSPEKPVVFCGNLAENKSGFVYELTEGAAPGLRVDLYGPGYTGNESSEIQYKGVYRSLELMDIMEGSFGLVWDGTSADTCRGACGEYLRYNNPHKMSHYLASGMPVLVWDEAAMADYVTAEGCGLKIRSLSEIPSLIAGLTETEYSRLRENAVRVGSDMREGKHIREAVEKALEYTECAGTRYADTGNKDSLNG